MSTRTPRTEGIHVVLLRLGVGMDEVALPPGATLADLLAFTEADIAGQDVFVDGRPLADAVVLKSGAVVTIVPRASNAVPTSSWRDTIGMFRDDPNFEAAAEAGRAYRESQREAVDDENADDSA